MFNFQKEDLLVNLKIYYISFILSFLGSLYQLFWPVNPVWPLGVINDSSGFSTIWSFYIWLLSFNIFMTIVVGLIFFRLDGSFKNRYWFFSVILILSPIWFWQLFFAKNSIFFNQFFATGWQSSIFSCLILIIFQFILIFFYQKRLTKRLIK